VLGIVNYAGTAHGSWDFAKRLDSVDAITVHLQDGAGKMTDRVEDFDPLSDHDRKVWTLQDIGCKSCTVALDFLLEHQYSVLIDELQNDCTFCDILRQCYKYFAPSCHSISIHYDRRRSFLQVCYQHPAPRHCREHHVQLYCTGMSGFSWISVGIINAVINVSALNDPFGTLNDITEPKSDAFYRVMQGYIEDCCQHHRLCNLEKREVIPTRLIRLSKEEHQKTYLCEPTSSVQFAALTYPWGTGDQSCTYNNNLVQRRDELIISQLPQTLQDAFHVARGLNLEYIWIDSLCIIQDDKDDWAREASTMADIYSGAYVVLLATATEICTDGFLQARERPLTMECKDPDGQPFELGARLNNSHTCSALWPKTDYALFKRGWCMQERFLARRIVHILRGEILFECQEHRVCECSAASPERIRNFGSQSLVSFRDLRAASNIASLDFATAWMAIVHDYSQTILTKPADRLPALSGIAASMEHLNPGSYIAGLWEYDLPLQLAWKRLPIHQNPSHNISLDCGRRGPTFSWSGHSNCVPNELYSHCNYRPICKLNDCQVQLATSNIYGEVLAANITLSGRCVPAFEMVSYLKRPGYPRPYWHGMVHLDGGFRFENETFPSTTEDADRAMQDQAAKNWNDVICLGLYEYDVFRLKCCSALLLRSTDAVKAQYMRIGTVSYLNRSWFNEHALETTVTIF
jgi:hypothetical protein